MIQHAPAIRQQIDAQTEIQTLMEQLIVIADKPERLRLAAMLFHSLRTSALLEHLLNQIIENAPRPTTKPSVN